MKIDDFMPVLNTNALNAMKSDANTLDDIDFNKALNSEITKQINRLKDENSHLAKEINKLANGLNLPDISTQLAKLQNEANELEKLEKNMQKELKAQERMFAEFELKSELNRAFFSSYGIKDKNKKHGLFDEFERINKLAKKLEKLKD